MYIAKTNIGQYPKNLLMINDAQSGCCGDGAKIIACRFRAKFATGTIATVDRVVIGGVTYSFSTARATTTAAGRAAIISEINDIVTAILGVHNGTSVISITGTTVRVTTDHTDLKFEAIGNGSATAKFAPVKCEIMGKDTSTNGGFEIDVVLNGDSDYDVFIKPHAGQAISALAITYDGNSKYSAAWPKPSSYSLPSGTTIVNGKVKFIAAAADAALAKTLAVSVTAGGSAVAYSQSVILTDYLNQ